MVCYARLQTRWFVEHCRRRNDTIICRERASCIQRNECFIQRTYENQRWWENIDASQRGTYDVELLQRLIISVTQLSVYGAAGDWCQDRTWKMIPRHKSQQRTFRTSPDHQSGILEPENLVRQHEERNSKIFQKTFNERKLVMTLVLMTVPDVHLAGYGSTSSCHVSSKLSQTRTERIYSKQHRKWSGIGSQVQKTIWPTWN